MNKGKSIFVTALVGLMLVLICAGLHILFIRGFFILVGLLAVCGFIHGAADFSRWLCKSKDNCNMMPVNFPGELPAPRKSETLTPPITHSKPRAKIITDRDVCIDAIIKEVNSPDMAET